MELDPLLIARLQFAFTIIWHIIFPAFTIGLSAYIATLCVMWMRTGKEHLHDFAGDLPLEDARVLYAVQQPFKKSLTTEKTTNAAWRTKPTFYAVSTQDRTINPDLERFMAKRMSAKT